MSQQPFRIAVMVSGSGSNFQALIDASEHGQLPGVELALVICNRADAPALRRALDHKIPCIYLPWRDRSAAEKKLTALLKLFEIDLVVLAGWMRIFNPDFIEQFPGRIINLHPALLPDDGSGETYVTSNGITIPAFRGLHVVQRALDAGIPITGTTVHYVIPEVDAGPVIARAEVAIQPEDTEETLHERIKQAEHTLVVDAVKQLYPG